MLELTREYLDKKLDKLATKQDIIRLGTKIETEVAELAGMVAKGFAGVDKRFDEVEKKLDVRAEVDELKVKMSKVWNALNIKN